MRSSVSWWMLPLAWLAAWLVLSIRLLFFQIVVAPSRHIRGKFHKCDSDCEVHPDFVIAMRNAAPK